MGTRTNLSIKLAKLAKEAFRCSKGPITGRITIRLTDALGVRQTEEEDIDQKYDSAARIILNVRQHCDNITEEALADGIELELCTMVFGSNFIEGAGTNFEETLVLCRKVFRGENFTSSEPERRSEDYETGLLEMLNKLHIATVAGLDNKRIRARGRLEVIQHARALKFFIEKFNIENTELTESLILQTHRILCEGHEHDDGTPWEEWAGVYRDYEIAASSIDKETKKRNKSIFIRANAVSQYMRTMVREFNGWVVREGTNTDPFEVASWLCTQFVNIHPFADGNGRMCRILLNGVLYKYTGLLACIGENEDGRTEYLELANKANKIYHQEDCETEIGNQTSHVRLTKLVIQKVTECGERLSQKMRARRVE
ncbi:hypothetical protein ABW20_dc0105319 [Dactylellina cionopaga]|nr:hypothetical protein ABW20_dc0105319 [Dactylellina cionopaga]